MTEERTVPRTRASREPMDAHVVEVAGMMAAGTWKSGETAQVLAAEHGVTVAAVEKWSAAAARMLRLLDAPAMQALRARNVARLDEVYEDAADDGDHKARVSAIAEQNKLLGLIVQRMDVTGSTVSAEEWDAWRSAIATELCDACRAKLLDRVRKAKEIG